jgi:hypothetical protein
MTRYIGLRAQPDRVVHTSRRLTTILKKGVAGIIDALPDNPETRYLLTQILHVLVRPPLGAPKRRRKRTRRGASRKVPPKVVSIA